MANGISEYSLPSANSRPYGLTLDSNDNLWLTESDNSANRIAEVQLASDFNIQLTSPPELAVAQGGTAAFLISVSPVSGSKSQVSLSVNAPSGLKANFIPSIPLMPPFNATLTITTMVSTPLSTYVMSITATSISATHSLCIALTVLSTSPVTSTVSSTSSQSSVGCPVSNSIPEFPTSLPILAFPLLFIALGVRDRRKPRVSKTTRRNCAIHTTETQRAKLTYKNPPSALHVAD